MKKIIISLMLAGFVPASILAQSSTPGSVNAQVSSTPPCRARTLDLRASNDINVVLAGTAGSVRCEVRIYDALGRVWDHTYVVGSKAIDVAGFPEGNYILCAYTANGTLTGRFVVRH